MISLRRIKPRQDCVLIAKVKGSQSGCGHVKKAIKAIKKTND